MGVYRDFIQSVREYGLVQTLQSTYQFSETRVLYELSRRGVFDSGFVDVPVSDIRTSSDTVIILGSGSSINDISDEEWAAIADTADTMAFNHFYRGQFVDIDYHIVREMARGPSALSRHEDITSYLDGVDSNPHYDETVFFALHDRKATDTIWALYVLDGLAGRPVCRYQNDRSREMPGETIEEIAHLAATLFDAINLSYLLGYDRIVLAGVDLYDRRYFWLDEDETRKVDKNRGASETDAHNTTNPVLETIPRWKSMLNDSGVELSVENERSLLCTHDVLPSFDISSDLG